MTKSPFAVRPDFTPHKGFSQSSPLRRPSDALFRAIACYIKSGNFLAGDNVWKPQTAPIIDVIKEAYGEDNATRLTMAKLITKAAVIPADTTTSHWASDLVQTVIADFIESLMPISVYGQLKQWGDFFTFGKNGVLSMPSRNTATTVAASFVGQGLPIPVRQGAFISSSFTAKKMAVITTLTREIMNHSTPSIEAIVRSAILEDTAVAIDSVLLDANPATTTRPAGLKNGVGKITASATASIVGFAADIKGLAAALITGARGHLRSPVWLMNPTDALSASLLPAAATGDYFFQTQLSAGTLLGYPIVTSSNVTADSMFLLDAADFVSATGEEPNFTVADQTAVHMEDTSPTGITVGGATPSFASPVMSFFQQDVLGIRMIMDMNFGMRRSGLVAWSDTLAWN